MIFCTEIKINNYINDDCVYTNDTGLLSHICAATHPVQDHCDIHILVCIYAVDKALDLVHHYYMFGGILNYTHYIFDLQNCKFDVELHGENYIKLQYEIVIFSHNNLTTSFLLSLRSITLTGYFSASNESSTGTCTRKLYYTT